MKAGKLSESVLKRSVLRQLHNPAPHTPGVGVDFGAVEDSAGKQIITAEACRAFGTETFPEAGVYAALNNLVCSGAKPLGITMTLLLPTCASENDLRAWISAVSRVSDKEQIPVLGGHTEVLRSVTAPQLIIQAVGEITGKSLVTAAGAQPDMDVIVTKWVGLEGTAILAMEHRDELSSRYAQPFLDKASRFMNDLSIRSEAAVAAQSGVAAMHDLSEGGIFGALWEMGQCSGVGLEIDLKKIPIRQETIEICEFYDLNPYKLLSGGSLLLAAKDGNALVHAIRKAGVEATMIGRTTSSNDRVLINGEEHRFLETTQTDELWKI